MVEIVSEFKQGAIIEFQAGYISPTESDDEVVGMMVYRGEWDASGGVLPSPAPRQGYVYRLNPGGEVPYLGGTVELSTGTLIMALVNSPGQNMVNYTTL